MRKGAILWIVILYTTFRFLLVAGSEELAPASETDIAAETLYWTKNAAYGSWAGSVFGAIALVISIIAFRSPQRVKMDVSISVGSIISIGYDLPSINVYTIEIRNIGIKPISITDIRLHFGDKKQGDIFIGALNQETRLQTLTPNLPARIEQGEVFSYHLAKDKLDKALVYYEGKNPLDSSLLIRVDDAIKGKKYFKTKWTLNNFIGELVNNKTKEGNDC